MQNDIDTTAYMQEILEAYRILSNPDKRKKYNQKLFGKQQRVFRTYTMTDAKEEDTDFPSFVTYWNAACKLNETIEKSIHLMEYKAKKKSLPQKIFRKIGKDTKKDTFRLQTTKSIIPPGNSIYCYFKKCRDPNGLLESRCYELGTRPLGTKTEYGLSCFILQI